MRKRAHIFNSKHIRMFWNYKKALHIFFLPVLYLFVIFTHSIACSYETDKQGE